MNTTTKILGWTLDIFVVPCYTSVVTGERSERQASTSKLLFCYLKPSSYVATVA